MIRFYRESMCDYFRKFDYIEYKYEPLFENITDKMAPETEEVVSMFKKGCVAYERTKNNQLYDKIDYSQIHERLEMIYGSDEADSDVFLYDFSLDYLIDRYLNIPSLDKLFSHHYFEYEWEQHVDMNFEKNELSFYRDHFIHSIRNCFMIMRYLDYPKFGETSYYAKVEAALRDRSDGISKYACSQVEQYVNLIRKDIRANSDMYVSGWRDKKEKDEFKGVLNEYEKEVDAVIDGAIGNADKFAWNYLIRGSLIVAALFHDIGYPIRYTYKGNAAVSDYISLVTPTDSVGFDRLNNLLESSLLFKTVDKEELRSRYTSLDHGALSAFILLMQFYETGTINGLDSLKKAIIELAAVIIYDHTLKYRFLGDEKKGKEAEVRDKPSFNDKPLSFTLRFVDDIQEWDRMYFEIGRGTDFYYCERCNMPVVRRRCTDELRNALRSREKGELDGARKNLVVNHKIDEISADRYFSSEMPVDSSVSNLMICGCGIHSDSSNVAGSARRVAEKGLADGKEGGHHSFFGNFTEGSPFLHQRIDYTMTCDDVVLLSENGRDVFYIDYDPFKQLNLLILNHRSLGYRMKEFARLSRQFTFQSGINISAFTHITDNPMMLKLRMICDFIYEVGIYININPGDGATGYGRNATYSDMLGDFMKPDSMSKSFRQISDIVSVLKTKGFLICDYADEGFVVKPAQTDSRGFSAAKKTLNKILRKTVDSMIWPEDAKAAECYIRNLKNTAGVYLDLLFDFINAAGDDGGWPRLCENSDNPHYDFKCFDDNHKCACEIVYRDCVTQLYFLSGKDKKGSLVGLADYYSSRETKKKGGKNVSWNDKEYVIGSEEMGYAIDILFDERYYDPGIIREERDVNNGKFTFFDVYSDLYLFREMSGFIADNRKRRLGNL